MYALRGAGVKNGAPSRAEFFIVRRSSNNVGGSMITLNGFGRVHRR